MGLRMEVGMWANLKAKSLRLCDNYRNGERDMETQNKTKKISVLTGHHVSPTISIYQNKPRMVAEQE